jgi:hypothetical protein
MARASRNADETDAFSRWRQAVVWRRGEIRRIKRAANRRERHKAKLGVRREAD